MNTPRKITHQRAGSLPARGISADGVTRPDTAATTPAEHPTTEARRARIRAIGRKFTRAFPRAMRELGGQAQA